jgi:hypothetical protein
MDFLDPDFFLNFVVDYCVDPLICITFRYCWNCALGTKLLTPHKFNLLSLICLRCYG